MLTAVSLTLAVGIGMTLMISGRLRARLHRVSQEAVELGNDVEQLARAIRLEENGDSGTDSESRASQDRDIEAIWGNVDKANKELGWSADTPLEEILVSAWKWQKHLREEGIQ